MFSHWFYHSTNSSHLLHKYYVPVTMLSHLHTSTFAPKQPQCCTRNGDYWDLWPRLQLVHRRAWVQLKSTYFRVQGLPPQSDALGATIPAAGTNKILVDYDCIVSTHTGLWGLWEQEMHFKNIYIVVASLVKE